MQNKKEIMSKIKSIHAREIFDSRGDPTVEVELVSDDGRFIASVPSGASTGIYEAIELRDNDKKRHNGKGVLKAVSNVNDIIAPKLIGIDVSQQKKIDEIMIKIDGTKNKSCLGANAILGVSMAVCKAGAAAKKKKLYEYIGQVAGNKQMILPIPCFNVINGGRHAKNKLSFQEFMILPIGASNFTQAMKIGREIYNELRKMTEKEYGNGVELGDEGGFSPNINTNQEALDLLKKAIKNCNYHDKVRIGIDAAASEFFDNGKYNLDFKNSESVKINKMNAKDMIEMYKEFIEDYGIISIEDPFDQNDFDSYAELNKKIGKRVQIVGDDLLATNPARIKNAISKRLCNTLLLKINQIGTVSEAIDAFHIAEKAGWNIMVGNRSGETRDSFIADLAVGLGCGEIKSGAPFPIERLAKYNRLLEIERELKKYGKKPEHYGNRILKR